MVPRLMAAGSQGHRLECCATKAERAVALDAGMGWADTPKAVAGDIGHGVHRRHRWQGGESYVALGPDGIARTQKPAQHLHRHEIAD